MQQVPLGALQSSASPEPRLEQWEEKLAAAEITVDRVPGAMQVGGPSQVLIWSKGPEALQLCGNR